MTRRKKISLAFLLLALAVGGVYVARSPDRLHARARVEWKDRALERISERADPAWIEAEIARMATARDLDYYVKDNVVLKHLTDHLILLSNGEWIVYDAICFKEDRRIHDIFIGRASDGRWYYSTYHFCIGMWDVQSAGQYPDLASFIEYYPLVEFDGKSDECLELTWGHVPGGCTP